MLLVGATVLAMTWSCLLASLSSSGLWWNLSLCAGTSALCLTALLLTPAAPARAQGAKPDAQGAPTGQPDSPSPPASEEGGWDTQIGASFVGNSGNTSSTTIGVDFSTAMTRGRWKFDSSFNVLRVSRDGNAADRYIESVRVHNNVASLLSLTGGQRLEHDPAAGAGFRSILDGGLGWSVKQAPWTLEAVTALGWNHERFSNAATGITLTRDDTVTVLQALSTVTLGTDNETTRRLTVDPSISRPERLRAEGEFKVQASLTERLAPQLGYLIRYSRTAPPGFENIDSTASASLVVKWKTM